MIKLIRKSEWDVLYRNLINQGKSKWEASGVINKHKKILQDYYDKLIVKKITTQEKEIKFREKFFEMVERSIG